MVTSTVVIQFGVFGCINPGGIETVKVSSRSNVLSLNVLIESVYTVETKTVDLRM